MKLKAKRNLTVNGINNLAGSVFEVDEKDANVILGRKWATEVKESKKAEIAKVAPKPVAKKAPAKPAAKPTAKKAEGTKSAAKPSAKKSTSAKAK